MYILPLFPPFSVIQTAGHLVRRLRERRRLRPAGDGPERRHRDGRPARPRATPRSSRSARTPTPTATRRSPASTCRSCRCSSSARSSPRSSASLLGAPTLRLRGDYLAIMTLGFGEIVPIVFLNLEHVHARHERHRRHLPAGAAAVPRDRSAPITPFTYFVVMVGHRHDRDDPAVPAPGFAGRPGLERDPRGRAGGRGERHQHRHDEAPRVRPRRDDGRPGRRLQRLEADDRLARPVLVHGVVHRPRDGHPRRDGQHLGRRGRRVHRLHDPGRRPEAAQHASSRRSASRRSTSADPRRPRRGQVRRVPVPALRRSPWC